MIEGRIWSEQRDRHEALLHATIRRLVERGLDIPVGFPIPVIERSGIYGYVVSKAVREIADHENTDIFQRLEKRNSSRARKTAVRVYWTVVFRPVNEECSEWSHILDAIDRHPHLVAKKKLFSPVWENSKNSVDIAE